MANVELGISAVGSTSHYYAGVAYLTSYLEKLGHAVSQQPIYISAIEDVLLETNPAVAWAIETLRNPRYRFWNLVKANKLLEETSRAVQTPDFFQIERNNVRYRSKYFDGTIAGAVKAVDDRESNLFYRHFAEKVLPQIAERNPDIYGLSVADEHMLVPALILAAMIKEAFPHILVTLGGNYWPRIKDAYKNPLFPELFKKCCHAIVWAEGYKPMAELAETLDPSKASGTLYLDQNGNLQINDRCEVPVEFEDLPTPVYPEIPTPWLSIKVPLLFTISNCNRNCGFCAIPVASDTYHCKRIRSMSPNHIAQDVMTLGAHYADFGDESLPIGTQLEVGKILKANKHSLRYCCYMTFDQSLLDPEVCEKLYKSGLRIVQLGLESFSQETLHREGKVWNKPETYGKIVENLAKAGIHVHLFYITGIPGEPLIESLRLITFLKKYGKWITTIKTGRWRLARGSRDQTEDRQCLYITVYPDEQQLHLNLSFAYKKEGGMTNKQVDAMNEILEAFCCTHWAYLITSHIHWCERLRYSRFGLKVLAFFLRTVIKERSAPPSDLKKALVKLGTIVRTRFPELKEIKFACLTDVVAFAEEHFPA